MILRICKSYWCVGNADASGWFVSAVNSLHLNTTALNRQRWTLNIYCFRIWIISWVSHNNVSFFVDIRCLITLECEPTIKSHLSFDSLMGEALLHYLACELFLYMRVTVYSTSQISIEICIIILWTIVVDLVWRQKA